MNSFLKYTCVIFISYNYANTACAITIPVRHSRHWWAALGYKYKKLSQAKTLENIFLTVYLVIDFLIDLDTLLKILPVFSVIKLHIEFISLYFNEFDTTSIGWSIWIRNDVVKDINASYCIRLINDIYRIDSLQHVLLYLCKNKNRDIINYLFTYELSTLSIKRKKVVSPMVMYHLYGIYNVIHVALTCVWNKLTKYYKILRWKLCLAISFHIDGDIDCSHVTMPNLCSFEAFSNNLTNLHIIEITSFLQQHSMGEVIQRRD